LRLPTISQPQLKMPRPPRTPSLALPRLQRPKEPRQSKPTVAVAPSQPAIGRFVNRITSRDFWALTRKDENGKGSDYTSFAVLLGGFSIVAVGTLVVVLIAALFSGSSSQPLVSPFGSTSPTASPPGDPPETPWIDAQLFQDDPLTAANFLWDTGRAAGSTDLVSAANHIRQSLAVGRSLNEDFLCPILDLYNADYSSGPAGSPACGGALVTPPPESDITLAMWANELNAWWFGDLPVGFASYSEGDEAPFLLTWAAEPGEEYNVEITYTCSVDGVPAIDILSGVQSADAEIFEAARGPGDKVPDAAVLLPDTSDVDDDNVRLLYLYGGDFLLLPGGPEPAAACEDERTISVPVHAAADASEMILMGSVRLADSGDHEGRGAADVAAGISLSAAVSAVGTAAAGFEPGIIAP